MSCWHTNRSAPRNAVVRRVWPVSIVLLVLVPSLEAGPIRWRGGTEELPSLAPSALHAALAARHGDPAHRHVVLRFGRPLTESERRHLAGAGIELLSSLDGRTYFVAFSQPTIDVTEVTAKTPLVGVAEIKRSWKLHPLFAGGDVPVWSRVDRQTPEPQDDPLVAAYVMLHRDVPLLMEGSAAAERHGAVIRAVLTSVHGLFIELRASAIPALADEDAVQWVEPPLPAFQPVADRNRELTQAEIVHNDPVYGLDGSGVSVMVYDAGVGDRTHPDYGGRLSPRDQSDILAHSTHVAGIIGGDGFASGGRFRGMAPAVSIESYGFQTDFDPELVPLFADPGDMESDYTDAITLRGVDLANNSIGSNTCTNGFDCEINGDYGVVSNLIDGIVRGSLGRPLTVVFSAGNERACERCRLEGVSTSEGYRSLSPPSGAKNHLCVGAVNANDDSMTAFSSWGPTDDGRIKPDVVAPGCEVGDDFGVTSLAVGGGYLALCGTSMSAPTVAGLAALVIQDFREQFPGRDDLRPATIKCLFAHNAVDVGALGPDYQNGYGSVRVADTIDFLRTGQFLENELGQSESRSLLVAVDPQDAGLKVTLTWDDVPATPNVTNALINDLDLRVYDPTGARYYPWTLDPDNPSLPAVRTRADHLNNMEQVMVDAPAPGLWLVQVFGFAIPAGPQTYSLCVSPRPSEDCDGNGLLDEDEILSNPELDCSGNGLLDVCELDCDGNALVDSCEIADGLIGDCDLNGLSDSCGADCDGDGTPDECEILAGNDCDGNGVPDDCEPDCNANFSADVCDIADGFSEDCDLNGVPDECQDTTVDCNGDGLWDACETALGVSDDFNGNAIPDECEDSGITFYVDAINCQAPGTGSENNPFCAIQSAIDASISGQTIVVAPGIYRGDRNRNLDFGGRAITLRSVDPSDRDIVLTTVVDAEQVGRGFFFHNGETRGAVVDGLTIRNGLASVGGTEGSNRGGGVYCRDASPTFRRCIVTNNSVGPTIFNQFGGGGFYLERSAALLDRCEIVDNSTANPGGAIYCFQNSHADIRGCLIARNEAFSGGGIALFASAPVIRHCTIVDNRAGAVGGAVHCNQAEPAIRDSILWRNTAAGVADQILCTNPTVSYTDIQGGWPGTENLDADPRFADVSVGDYHLTLESPCINAGDPLFVLPGALDIDGEPRISGGRVDMGADEAIDTDCNDNGVLDEDEIAAGTSGDCNENGLPDECEDCNENGIADECDIEDGTSTDRNQNGVPDECEPTRVFHVDDDGPSDPAPGDPSISDPNEDGTNLHPFDSIQEAIDAARSGDTVLIAPGLYRGEGNRDIDFGGRAITVRGLGDPAECVVDAQFVGRGFLFRTGETADARLENLSIIHGKAESGGGIFCDGASPTITRCRILDNIARSAGGGIYLRDSRAEISRCRISRNRVEVQNGGGIYCLNSSPMISHCVLRENKASFGGGGMFIASRSAPLVSNCEFAFNSATRGGAFYYTASTVNIARSTVTDNTATLGRGHSMYAISSEGIVRNSILWSDNNSSLIGQIFAGSRAVLLLSFNDIQGGEAAVEGSGTALWLEGNISHDPQFFDRRHGDFHLLPGSPCVNAGDSRAAISLGDTDLDGNPRVSLGRIDIGADELDADCNRNGNPDRLDVEDGISKDCNRNFVPDECEPDCDDNRIADDCDIALGLQDDCNDNGVPDDCELRSGAAEDDNGNGVLDECEKCRDDDDCDDGLYCNGTETCSDGRCFPGDSACGDLLCREDTLACVECFSDSDCGDGNGCTEDLCFGGTCRFEPIDDPCDDRDRCTLNDACSQGVCVGELAPDCGATFAIVAVAVNGVPVDHAPTAQIVVEPEDEITCEILLQNWQPQDLAVYQVTVDATGYSSGPRGQLEPLVDPTATAGAFIEQSREDFVFFNITALTAVSVSHPNYAYAALGLLDSVPDPQRPAYCGTLILIVSADAAGRFEVGLVDDEFLTFLSDRGAIPLTPLAVESLSVFVNSDCNGNGVADDVDIAVGTSTDCTGDGLPDECEVDCNGNGVADGCDLLDGVSDDCNGNGIPDDCEPDCNENDVADACDIASQESPDCNGNRIPDECDIRDHPERDCNQNAIPDKCEVDCNRNSTPDDCDIADGFSEDCDGNGIPDECERDCNENGVGDPCDVSDGTSDDLDGNGVPDECQQLLRVPKDFDTIQEAIDAAEPGDTVELDEGVYSGSGNFNIQFRGKALTLRCKTGVGTCVIQPNLAGRGLWIRSGEGPTTRIEGIVITTATSGVQITAGASPTFADCRFVGNGGSGVFLSGAGHPLFRRCYIGGNGVHGLFSSSSGAVVENSVFVDNAESGVFSRLGVGIALSHCTISGNGSPPTFVGGESLMRNTIVYGDRSAGDVSISLMNDAVVTVEYCDIAGGADAVSIDESATLEWGAGNIDFDPRFVDPDGPDDDVGTWDDNDYHLSPHSVCIEAGDPAFVESADQTDVDGDPRLRFDVVDIGADEADEFLDCNANVTIDAHDIAFAESTDCNENGIPDECDIAETVSADCDGNALPDECDLSTGFAAEFPPQSPFGGGAPQAFLLMSPPAAYGNVLLTVAAAADLNGAAEFIDVRLNGVRVASVFQNSGTACGDPADTASIMVPYDVYNDALNGGDLLIELFATTSVNEDRCIDGTSVAVAVRYDAVAGRPDCNRDGVPDKCEAGVRHVTQTDPPSGAIDARQPHALDDPLARFGWTEIVLTFACHISEPSPFDFVLTASDTERDAPEVENVVLLDGHTVRLEFSEPIDPGAWTIVTHEPTGARVCLGYLPGDVTGDGLTAISDIAALIDSINRVEGLSRPPYAADIDRSGVVGPQDILRLIDLLNGAATLDPWITRTLAVSPCD